MSSDRGGKNIFEMGFIPPAYLSRILPENLAREFHLVPLEIKDGLLQIAADNTLNPSKIDYLEEVLRRPVRIIPLTHTEVKRFQNKLYEIRPSTPGMPPVKALIEKLNIHTDNLPLSEISETATLADVDASDWLSHGRISANQWTQLMGWSYYLPAIKELSPSPINALKAFISRDRQHHLINQAFLPLWWAKDTLYLGLSDVDRIDAIKQVVEGWEIPYRILLIPPTLTSELNNQIPAQDLFSSDIHELEIARRLHQKGLISKQSLDAARSLKRSAGISLRDALLNEQPELSDPWLEAQAYLLDTFAITEKELPGNFQEQMLKCFESIPFQICKLLQVLPLNAVKNTVILGMAEIHPGVCAILEQVSNANVEARLMRAETIQSWLQVAEESFEKPNPFSRDKSNARAIMLATGWVQPEQLGRSASQDTQDIADDLRHWVSSGLINEMDMAQLLAMMFHLPWLSLENFRFDSDLISEFSQPFLNDNHLLPLAKFDHELWVALADPLDDQKIHVLEEDSGLEIWPVIVPSTALEIAINQQVNLLQMKEPTQYLTSSIDFLVDEGVLSEAHRPDIIHDVIQRGQPYDRVIKKYQQSDERDLYRLFSSFREIPYLSLAPEEEIREAVDPLGNRIEQTRIIDPVDHSIARRLDYETARQLRAIPIGYENDRIQIAFSTPLYDQALERLKRILQSDLYPCITPRQDLEDAIDRILKKTNIGTLLINAGLITRGELNDALTLAENTSSRIGQALIHRGYISEGQLYSFLSEQTELPFFDLSTIMLDQEVGQILNPDEAWEHGILPLSRSGENLVVGVIDPVNQSPVEFVEKKTSLNVRPVLITENDFEDALERLHHEHYTTQSVSALLSREPDNSAAQVITRPQLIILIAIILVGIALAVLNLQGFLIGINAIFTIIYILMIFYKFILIANAIGTDLEVPVSQADINALQDDQLPIYTILIPVYKEASVLPKVLSAITKLDYPKIKLDVKVLLEEDDQDTIDAFKKINPPEYIQGLIVPASEPKTKPKACNYGLIRARGDYVVIYDAEDKPEPDQLKKVIAAFQKIPANVICIQSKLNYFNRRQNLLTQWFSSEYSMWFDLFLPGLDARNAPIPLGGTSNHFKKFALVEAGAWDPHNVTEDADLGIRIYKLGYRTRIVDTTTYEEANSQVSNWIRQRSRWVKGYIQTWLVHMRHPIRLIREIGFRAFFSFQMVIGGNIFTVLLNPVYWLTTTIWFLFGADFIDSLFPGMIYILGAVSLFLGNFTFTYINVAGAMKRGYYDMVRAALVSPIYWGLMSIGGWKGFLQLITNPHYWEKTEHGLEGVEDEDVEPRS